MVDAFNTLLALPPPSEQNRSNVPLKAGYRVIEHKCTELQDFSLESCRAAPPTIPGMVVFCQTILTL